MSIVGCDYHPSFQQIAYVDTETGERKEQRIEHRESAEAFYRELASRGAKVRVGMEASGHGRWFGSPDEALGLSSPRAGVMRRAACRSGAAPGIF